MKRAQKKKRASSLIPIDVDLLRSWRLPEIDGSLGKVARGRLMVIGGTTETPGAVMLAGIAALNAGAGRLQLATASSVAALVAVQIPEARVYGLRHGSDGELTAASCRVVQSQVDACDALLIGPGMMNARAATPVLRRPSVEGKPAATIVDAGALGFFGQGLPCRRTGLILTPHPGEMARLMGCELAQVLEAPLELARAAAKRWEAIVVLKGARTLIAAPDGRTFENSAGCVGLGTSGSGDVLAGLITGLCARGAQPLQAAVWGVHLHALAGERLERAAPLGFLARELSGQVPPLLKELGLSVLARG
jgi:ADP-dependent NAD(P)H-hydrate dehydratase